MTTRTRKRRTTTFVLLGAQAAAALHLALVPHTRCSEHGELVEGAAVFALAPLQAHLDARRVVVAHGDEHCLVALCQRHRTAPYFALARTPQPPLLLATVLLPREIIPAFRPPLTYAPKQSPPA